jgi:uncharacterized membrane protein
MTDGETREKAPRYWEIDALRGVAIVWMAGFHLSWDLVFFGLARIPMSRNPWPWFSRIIATMFLTLSGISMVIVDNRPGRQRSFRRTLLRGGKVLGFGLIITLVTLFVVPDEFVVFGILHLIGFSIVAAYPFLPRKRRWISLAIGIVAIAVGSDINRRISLGPWLIPLGINQIGRGMVDWYPILPWFGMVLIGVFLGHALYPQGKRRFELPDGSHVPVVRQLCFLGRHSLLIYLVHQPLLIGILYGVAWVLSR